MSSLRRCDFEAVLRNHEESPGQSSRRAAVAILLRYAPEGSDSPRVLLMRRSVHAADRWSGQVSLPGGREEAGDESLRATAERETREEVGIDLAAGATYLGALDSVEAVARGRAVDLSISPFVYVATRPALPILNREAARVFWLPLAGARSGALDDVHVWEFEGASRKLPCWRYDGELIWGLTFYMLRALLRLVAP